VTGTREQHPDAGSGQRQADIDELRQRLRSLGYLDAGVDRFVLGPARHRRRPSAIALLSSIRVGALGGLLLGPAAVVGLGGRMPGLITDTQDAIVLAIYLISFFAVAVTAAAFVASLAVAWLAQRAGSAMAGRARSLSLAAGVAVAVVCLVYLTLWWQTASAGLGWSAPVRTGLALAVAVGISLLLGHAVTITALAVIVAGSGITTHVPGVPGASWRASLAAAALAFLGAAALLVVSAPAESSSVQTPPLTVVPSGVRVRVIAIDGVDPGVFAELRDAGKMPALSRILGKAAVRLELPSAEADRRDPARAWTTIATGQPVERHGVYGLETRRVAGVRGRVPLERSAARAISAATDLIRLTRPSVASGTERREKTFWEVAADAGLRTVVVNWWATWPAPLDAGVVLSDRATLRLERGGRLDAEIAPGAVYEQLHQRWPTLKKSAADLAARALETTTADSELRPLLQRSLELDADQLVLTSEVAGGNTDLVAVYLPGLDIAQHALLSPEDRTASPSALGARLRAIRDYYIALDRLLLSFPPTVDGEVLFVVTAPGRVAGGGIGLLGAQGPVVQQTSALAARTTDVCPTILHALGVPISAGLAGAPIVELFDRTFWARYPVRHVTTYGTPSNRASERQGQPLDQEMIDRLRSLGYVR
jgi:type I phosphodiesterase/nucleotide pyrophosphatase